MSSSTATAGHPAGTSDPDHLLLSRLRLRRVRIGAALFFYLLLALIPLAFGQPHLTGFALLPLVFVPPVTYLAYLIAWHEFHR